MGQVRVCSKITQQKQFFGTKIVKLQPKNFFYFLLEGEICKKFAVPSLFMLKYNKFNC